MTASLRLLALFLAACAADRAPTPELAKGEILRGKADGPDLCRKIGAPPGCDLCDELGWYGDDDCDEDLIEAGLCDGPDPDCDGPPEAEALPFRTSELRWIEPRLRAPIGDCVDVTPWVDQALAGRLGGDADGDGAIDLGFLAVYRPSSNTDPVVPTTLGAATCTPAEPRACGFDGTPAVTTAAIRWDATCLAPVPGTIPPGVEVPEPTPPCVVTEPAAVTLPLGLVEVPLEHARFGASVVGAGPLALERGLVRGFLSEAAAEATAIDASVPFVGGAPLASVLPGGAGACASVDARDVGPDGVTRGWYLHLGYAAEPVALAADDRAPPRR
jgi:hypothetical protein